MSIGQVGTVSSYIVPIACMLRKRILKEPLLPSRFDLGRGGIYVNIVALCFLVLAFVFPFFPMATNPTPASMNWTVLVTGFTMVVAMIYYVFKARHVYKASYWEA